MKRRVIEGEPGLLISVFWLRDHLRIRQGDRVITVPMKDAERFAELVQSAVHTPREPEALAS